MQKRQESNQKESEKTSCSGFQVLDAGMASVLHWPLGQQAANAKRWKLQKEMHAKLIKKLEICRGKAKDTQDMLACLDS